MTRWRLLVRTLRFHWRSNLAVALGVIAGTAVIAGALVVGDSVRTSLVRMHLDRLGKVEHAILAGDRFVREELVEELNALSEGKWKVAPGLMMRGGLEAGESGVDGGRGALRVGGVMLYGVDDRFWSLVNHGQLDPPRAGEVILSEGVAAEFTANLSLGQQVRLWLELPSAIPRDTLLGERDDDTVDLPLKVQQVIGTEDGEARRGVGRFDVNPSQQSPKIAYVALETLQEALGMQQRRVRNREARRIDVFPSRINTLFFSVESPASDTASEVRELQQHLRSQLKLDDLGLSLRAVPDREYLSLESNRMVLDDAFSTSGGDTPRSPVLVHLANRLVNDLDTTRYSMYSIVAGIDPTTLSEAPFGPFVSPGEENSLATLPDDQMVVNRWLATDLGVKPGDTVRMDYHLVGSDGELPEETLKFRVHGIVELEGAAADRGLTPHVPGITDVESFQDWRQPFKMDLGKLTDRDDEYWTAHRGTPKAFVTINTAQRLWQSRYGKMTSLRFAVDPGQPSARDELEESILGSFSLNDVGLGIQPIRHRGVLAASGTTPFSGLFIGFSFFLIGSATILIGLLFRLGIERRGRSIGLMTALGMTRRDVMRLHVGEGLVVVTLAGGLGCLAAIAYARVMIYGLTHWWVGAVGTTFLQLEVRPASLAGGFTISLCVAGAALFLAAHGLFRLPARELLAGVVRVATVAAAGKARKVAWVSGGMVGVFLLTGTVLPEAVLSSEAFSGLSIRIVTFFLVGLSAMTVAIASLSVLLAADQATAIRGRGFQGLLRLGFRNASRHRARSVLSVALIASAAFVITAVAAGRRNPVGEIPDRTTGNGGFLLVAESSQPLLYDPGTTYGQKKLEFLDEADAVVMGTMDVQSFRVKPGEESSCLNLYQTRLPTVLGVPARMRKRGGFKFVNTSEANPWSLLEGELKSVQFKGERNVPVYPVLGDMNTLQYSLHKGVGQTVGIPDDESPRVLLQIVGMLDASVFQGVLLLGEENFLKVFPDQSGYGYFLVGDTRFDQAAEVKAASVDDVTTAQLQLLESRLREYGFDAEPVSRRLQRFLAVQNTYLLTFQVLGGLGLLLGSVGLATVMLRNVLERRTELALLRAIGFRRGGLRWLVLGENAFLLMWGLAAGTGAALLAMVPHLATAGADVGELASGLAVVLTGVSIAGMLAAGLAVSEAVRTPVVETLRGE